MKQAIIDLTQSDDLMIRAMARDAVLCGDFSNYDHAYETIWDRFERERENSGENNRGEN